MGRSPSSRRFSREAILSRRYRRRDSSMGAEMSGGWTDYRVFWREFRQHYHTTGAIAPSGRALARALARFAAQQHPAPRRILEVGPGTGAVTETLVRGLGPEDRLDLVELNDRFVQRLRDRFQHEPAF